MPDYTTRLGHTHLKVRDLERSIAFYTRFFDLKLIERAGDIFAFLSGGAVHHELALQAHGLNAPSPPAPAVGLYHVAFEVPDHAAFARAYRALRQAGLPLAVVDHGISWAMYFDDPDGNGLEIYLDRRNAPGGRASWRGESRPIPETEILAGASH